MHDGVSERLKPGAQVTLVDRLLKISSLPKKTSVENRFKWQSDGLHICPVFRRDRRSMTPREIVIYSRSRNTLPGLVLSNPKFLNVSKTMLTSAEPLEVEYCFPIIDAKTDDIAVDLRGTNFLLGASSASCKRHIGIIETILQWHEAVEFVWDDAPDVICTTHLDDKKLAISRDADTLLLLPAGPHYLSNTDRQKRTFPVHVFHKAEAQYVSALGVLFWDVRSHNHS